MKANHLYNSDVYYDAMQPERRRRRGHIEWDKAEIDAQVTSLEAAVQRAGNERERREALIRLQYVQAFQ